MLILVINLQYFTLISSGFNKMKDPEMHCGDDT